MVTVPEANYEQLQKDWKKELEAKTKSKVVIENGEWSIFGANTKNLSPTPVNIYSTLIKMDSLVETTGSSGTEKGCIYRKAIFGNVKT